MSHSANTEENGFYSAAEKNFEATKSQMYYIWQAVPISSYEEELDGAFENLSYNVCVLHAITFRNTWIWS